MVQFLLRFMRKVFEKQSNQPLSKHSYPKIGMTFSQKLDEMNHCVSKFSSFKIFFESFEIIVRYT